MMVVVNGVINFFNQNYFSEFQFSLFPIYVKIVVVFDVINFFNQNYF